MHRICCSVLLFMVLCSQSLAGESQLIGSSDPIVAVEGDDVILPCSLEPPIDTENPTVEWTRPDLKLKYVHFYRHGRNENDDQNPSYRDRTRLFKDELVRGNVSLKLSRVKLEDTGRYTCLVIKDGQVKKTVIQLRVDSYKIPFAKIVFGALVLGAAAVTGIGGIIWWKNKKLSFSAEPEPVSELDLLYEAEKIRKRRRRSGH